jgi:hypothetical protein
VTALKYTLLAVAVVAFFWLFVFGPLYGNLAAQAGLLAGMLVLSTIRFSGRETLTLLKFCLPFVLTLLLFGFIFQWLALLGRRDWIIDTLIKCLIFPSSLVFLKIVLSFITYLDLLRLPLSMARRLDLITLKSAFQKGGATLKRMLWLLDTYPMLEGGSRLKTRRDKYVCLIVALYLYLYQEIETSQRVLLNRYHHLREENREKP